METRRIHTVFGCSEDPDVKGTETSSFWYLLATTAFGCSEDPDVKGTETFTTAVISVVVKRASCSEDPDVKGTETYSLRSGSKRFQPSCSEDPDVKGTETMGKPLEDATELVVAARIPM